MEFRLFQILAIAIAAFFVLRTLFRILSKKADVYSNFGYLFIWLLVLVLAVFPDQFSRKMANIFGFKDNINAVIFVFFGILIFLQFKMFNTLRRQEKSITALYRKMALIEEEQETNEDSLRS